MQIRRNAAGARRGLCVALLAVMAVGVATVPAQGTASAPGTGSAWAANVPAVLTAGEIEVTSVVRGFAPSGYPYLAGRVTNRSGRVLESIGLGIDVRDGTGAVVGTEWGSVGDVTQLDPGASGRFVVHGGVHSDPARWQIREIRGTRSGAPANHNFTVVITGQRESEGFHYVAGTVRNDNMGGLPQGAEIRVTYLDGAGNPLGFGAATLGANALAPGATVPFEAGGWGGWGHTSFDITVNGSGAPTPAPTTVTWSGPAAAKPGARVTLAGRAVLRGTETGAFEAPVLVRARLAGSSAWHDRGSTTTTWDGHFSVAMTVDHTMDIRIEVAGERHRQVGPTQTLRVQVGSQVGPPRTTRKRLFASRPVYLIVQVRPADRGRTVVLQRKINSRWTNVGKDKTNDQAESYFTQRLKAGKHPFRAVVKATGLNGSATSKAVTVKVQRG